MQGKRLLKLNNRLKIALVKAMKYMGYSSLNFANVIGIPDRSIRSWKDLKEDDGENEPKEGVYA